MASRATKKRFALDHNFPAPVLSAFGVMMANVELVPIREIDPSFSILDDWELFVALHLTATIGMVSLPTTRHYFRSRRR
jgi:hypothetical protein